MNFSIKNLVPVTAFAVIASVAASAPAQALSLTGGIGFAGSADIEKLGDDDYNLDFLNPSYTLRCDGDFNCIDLIALTDFNIVDGAIETGTVSPFITGIDTDQGDVSFVLTDIGNLLDNGGSLAFNLNGYFINSFGEQAALGAFSGEYDATNGTFSGNLAAVAVPTPAAVLPLLAGLFGAASKRKRDEEEQA